MCSAVHGVVYGQLSGLGSLYCAMCGTAYGAVYGGVCGRFSGLDSLYCAVCGALYDAVYSQFPGPDSPHIAAPCAMYGAVCGQFLGPDSLYCAVWCCLVWYTVQYTANFGPGLTLLCCV